MSRRNLRLKASIFRVLQALGRYCDLYLSYPLPQWPSFIRKVPATVGDVPGSFDLYFYTPASYDSRNKRRGKASNSTSLIAQPEKYSLLVNFHGGGWTIGHPSDDARWALEVTERTGAVVVSVNYRLAPEYPFPVGNDDCVSAILYLWRHADELNLDISRTALSGFSAGGNFCFTVAYRLHEELCRLKEDDQIRDTEIGELTSVVSFYPVVDWSNPRPVRSASNPHLTPVIPSFLGGFFDNIFEDSYLYPKSEIDLHSPLVSPALASDEMVRDNLPENVVIFTCWKDTLRREGDIFRERLRTLGKTVNGYMIDGVPHGWDKWPSMWWGNASRSKAYKDACDSLNESWGSTNGVTSATRDDIGQAS
jgi:acetyl esterase/lipase